MAPTVSIETFVIIRPLKVLSVLCGCTALVLQILSVGASSWMEARTRSEDYREGLWERCDWVDIVMPKEKEEDEDVVERGVECLKNLPRLHAYILACRAMTLVSVLLCLLAIILISRGLQSTVSRSKYSLYKAGMVVYFLAVISELIALIVYPIKYIEELEEKPGPESQNNDWEFGWAYGIGWGAAIFMFGGAILVLLDKETDEIQYREKICSGDDEDEIEGV